MWGRSRNHEILVYGIAIFLFWMCIGIIQLSQTYLSSQVRNWDFIWGEQLVYAAGWAIWGLFTPFILIYVARNPIDHQDLQPFAFKLLAVGLVVALLHCTIDFFTEFFAFNLFIGDRGIANFYGVFFYKYHVNFFVFLFIAGAAYGYTYLKKSRQYAVERLDLESKLAKAQLASLKMQLHPHFLFNTHHAIIGLMLKEQNDKAVNMLTKLSDLLRLTLDSNGEQLVPLKSELHLVSVYLEIHKQRFGDRFQYQLDVPQLLMEEKIPNLLLQPLVENSLQHGVSVSSGVCELTLTIREENSRLTISVEDSGPGVSGNLIEGIGLSNTRERLQHLYGANYTMKIQNKSSGGFAIFINIPISLKTKTAHVY